MGVVVPSGAGIPAGSAAPLGEAQAQYGEGVAGGQVVAGVVGMNLERVSNEDKLTLCRKYYLGGFALLPFLWLVNVVWFFQEAFLKPPFTEQLQIRKYVRWSAVGLLLWIAALTTWITVYQTFRPEWGAVGDYISFTIPLGIP